MKTPKGIDDNLIITNHDYNVFHVMYDSFINALKHESAASKIRMTMPRQMVIDWCRSYEKLTGFMNRGNLIRPG